MYYYTWPTLSSREAKMDEEKRDKESTRNEIKAETKAMQEKH